MVKKNKTYTKEQAIEKLVNLYDGYLSKNGGKLPEEMIISFSTEDNMSLLVEATSNTLANLIDKIDSNSKGDILQRVVSSRVQEMLKKC